MAPIHHLSKAVSQIAPAIATNAIADHVRPSASRVRAPLGTTCADGSEPPFGTVSLSGWPAQVALRGVLTGFCLTTH